MACLDVRAERWPIAGAFVISRGAKTEAQVIVVEVADAGFVGRGECTPYGRYGETCASVLEQIEAFRSAVEADWTAPPCKPCWRRARRATPSIALCGTWRPNAAGGGPMHWPDWRAWTR